MGHAPAWHSSGANEAAEPCCRPVYKSTCRASGAARGRSCRQLSTYRVEDAQERVVQLQRVLAGAVHDLQQSAGVNRLSWGGTRVCRPQRCCSCS